MQPADAEKTHLDCLFVAFYLEHKSIKPLWTICKKKVMKNPFLQLNLKKGFILSTSL